VHTTLDTAISLLLGIAAGLGIMYFVSKRKKTEERES
jgi:hypothetical protein